MKGFIEVTHNTRKTLININAIERMERIYLNRLGAEYTCLTLHGYDDWFDCKESYEEVKQKIEEAMR